MVLPEGLRVESLLPHLEAFRDKPWRRRTVDHLESLEALIVLTQRHQDPTRTVVFGTVDPEPCIETVFDYHPASADLADAAWRQHRVRYEPWLSPEWEAWTKACSGLMTQREFAEFIEEHVSDLVDPDPSFAEAQVLADKLQRAIGGEFTPGQANPDLRAHGRKAYALNLYPWGLYVDLSVMPRITSESVDG